MQIRINGDHLMKRLVITLISLHALVASAGQITTGPVQQVGTTNQHTNTWKRDHWQPDKRFNEIDPKTGLRTGSFIERDTWEPKTRWNVYDQKGKYNGMIERDPYESDRWNFSPSGVGKYNDGIGDYDDGIGD